MASNEPSLQPIFRQGESFLFESLPINTLNSIQALSTRLRNPTLYVFPTERQTLVSLAETIATESLLRALEIPFIEVERYNANHMSPNGLVPLLFQDPLLAGGYEKILDVVNSMYPHLLAASADTRANCEVIYTVVSPTLHYFQFLTNETVRYGPDLISLKLPFPVNHIVPFQETLALRIKHYGTTERKMLQQLDSSLHTLDQFTGKGVYPEGDKHLAFSCCLYGYLCAMFEGFKEGGNVMNLLQAYSNLNRFYDRMKEPRN